MRFGWHFVSKIKFLIYNWCKPLDYYIILLGNLTNSSISSLCMKLKQPLPSITINSTSAPPHNYDQSPVTTSCRAVSPQPLLLQSTSSQYISSCFNLKYHFSTKVHQTTWNSWWERMEWMNSSSCFLQVLLIWGSSAI